MNANNILSCIPYMMILHAHRLIETGSQKSGFADAESTGLYLLYSGLSIVKTFGCSSNVL